MANGVLAIQHNFYDLLFFVGNKTKAQVRIDIINKD